MWVILILTNGYFRSAVSPPEHGLFVCACMFVCYEHIDDTLADVFCKQAAQVKACGRFGLNLAVQFLPLAMQVAQPRNWTPDSVFLNSIRPRSSRGLRLAVLRTGAAAHAPEEAAGRGCSGGRQNKGEGRKSGGRRVNAPTGSEG